MISASNNPTSMKWIQALAHLAKQGSPHVLITVVAVAGSSPRDVGCKMIVTASDIYDTIGGGQLEYSATTTARDILAANQASGSNSPALRQANVQQIEFNLGPDLGQCCGGRVSLMFECLGSNIPSIVLFGAGHVAQALMRILPEIPVQVTWQDTRPDYVTLACRQLGLPKVDGDSIAKGGELPVLDESATGLPVTVSRLFRPLESVEQAPANSYFVVMTHCHELDFELTEAILSRSDILWCGLIASRSKASRFSRRLSKMGFTSDELSRFVTPIGLTGINGKEPMSVAVSVAAQLLQEMSLRQDVTQTNSARKNTNQKNTNQKNTGQANTEKTEAELVTGIDN